MILGFFLVASLIFALTAMVVTRGDWVWLLVALVDVVIIATIMRENNT